MPRRRTDTVVLRRDAMQLLIVTAGERCHRVVVPRMAKCATHVGAVHQARAKHADGRATLQRSRSGREAVKSRRRVDGEALTVGRVVLRVEC
eukprot:6471488-Prymnesium_polylepis.1